AGGFTAETSWDAALAGVVVVTVAGSAEPRLGAAGSAAGVVAAGVGVTDAVVVAVGPAACGRAEGLPPPMRIIVCTASAIPSAATTPRPIAVFFCFAAFSLAVSAAFFRATSRSFLTG